MNKLFCLPGFCLLMVTNVQGTNDPAAASSPVIQDSPPGKKVIVYTTADNTKYRLTASDTLQLSDFGQPLETQPCVFVDPSKTFQTMVELQIIYRVQIMLSIFLRVQL